MINPGLPPMIVAIIGYVLRNRPLPKLSIVGYVGITAGIVMLVTSSPADVGFLGATLLIISAMFWALYSIGMEQTQMDPFAAALLVSVPSAIMATVLLLVNLDSSRLLSAPIQETLAFTLVLGVGVGVLAMMAYSSAINHLSARISATAGAVSPGLTAIIAMPVFGERVTLIGAIGIGLVAVGIILANRR